MSKHAPSRFAAATTVPTDRSKQDIERLLQRHGATRFASTWDEHGATIAFVMGARHVRFELPLPRLGDARFDVDGRNARRSPAARERVWEQECRAAWRALLLIVKAKLEAVTAHVATFDDEFLAYLVVKGNRTVGEVIAEQLGDAAKSGVLLLGPRS